MEIQNGRWIIPLKKFSRFIGSKVILRCSNIFVANIFFLLFMHLGPQIQMLKMPELKKKIFPGKYLYIHVYKWYIKAVYPV